MTIQKGIETLSEFYNILQNNKRVVVLKFGAEWCSPCKKIEGHVHNWFERIERDQSDITKDITLIYIDVDESFELYAHLRSKKMIKGIPAILAYNAGNTSFVFDESVSGIDENEIDIFFQKVISFR